MERDLESTGLNLRRLAQEVAETRRRMVIGGSFYVLGWVLVCLFTPVVPVYPWMSAALAAIFVGLAMARIVIRPPGGVGTETSAKAMTHWLDLQWIIIQMSAATWGGVVFWTLVDPVLVDARVALLIGAAGFATAIAHTYCMRFWPSMLAIVAIYLPSTLLMWTPEHDRAVAFSLTVYLFYVISSLVRSHHDFHRRLDFEEELRQQRDRFEWMSRTDDLTGLANRRQFVTELERRIAECQREHCRLSLLELDIDHFKQINDAHGHSIGDRCLVAFADQLRHVFAGQDELCARLGGEEFAVIVPHHDVATTAERADAFRIGLSAVAVVPELADLRVRVSIGVGEFNTTRHGNADHFLSEVDGALYRAKGGGRDRVCRALAASSGAVSQILGQHR
ncbi:MAG TPA: GGDEF domain-containing protein [Pseudomonadota bacterium]|nr:GGDEF domain-containing protein [Rhodanobacteraceae bacterium]HQW81855.1 GGDEF domain-containing protein [Pseudomonadota bacterium]